jgi:hypothetical protein
MALVTKTRTVVEGKTKNLQVLPEDLDKIKSVQGDKESLTATFNRVIDFYLQSFGSEINAQS